MATVKNKVERQAMSSALAVAQQISGFKASKLWLDYDAEADVLYISLKRPQRATETVERDEENVLLHYHDKELVGITVLDVSKR